ncbi:hypothetical protein [Pseudomonas sp. 11/12A]|uniref:hypothetical protein n=1 Tax=Pseudomonas sp. 11/12A TaxID=1506582 RepID=UPI0006490D7D|nr:hypothetical protein [Pseudomonas sp. 11/12A]
MDLLDILSSAVISVLVAALITLRTIDRKVRIENITQERAKWEEKIRGKSQLTLTRRPGETSIPKQYLPCESATIGEAMSDPTDKK